ncbi:MAG: NEW3 domain-containing protein [Thermoplasmatota archaeon]
MKAKSSSEWKRLFQIFAIIILVASGLAVFVYNMPVGNSVQAYDVSLTVDKASKEVSAGQQVTYAFTLTNEGNNGDRYTISSTVSTSPTGWQVTLSKTTTSNIASGGTDTFTVSVRAPTGVNISAYCYATIKATSQNDPINSSQSVLLSTIIKRTYGVLLESPGIKNVYPGDAVTYRFNVTNSGNDLDGYNLEATTVPTGWSASIDFDTGKFEPNTKKQAIVTIQSPSNAKAQTYQVTVRARSLTDNTTSATRTITTNVKQEYKLSIQSEGVKQVDITTQTVVNFNVQITNLGNGEDQFNLQYYIPPQYITAGWGGDLSTTTTSKVVADGKVNVTFFAYPPSKSLRPAVNSKGEFYINATSVGDGNIKRSVKVSCVVQPFYDVRILNTGSSLKTVDPDGTITFTFNVTNIGNDQDDFDFEVQYPDGFQDTSVEPSSITLPRDGKQLVTVTVTPDADIVLAQTYTLKIYANSTHGPSVSSSFQAKINKDYGAFLDAPNGAIISRGQPGNTYSIMVRLQNKGNGRDAFNLAVNGETQQIQTDWSPLISAATTPLLDSDQVYYFNITVSAPSTSTEGTYRFMVNASSQNSNVFKTIWLSVRIPQLYAVDITANRESMRGQFSNDTGPARKVYFDMDVFNRGSGTDTSIKVSVKQAPSGFAGLYTINFVENSKSQITINGGESKAARMTMDMPKISSGISAGTYQFTVETRSDNGTLTNTADDKIKTITLNLVLDPVHRVRILSGINSSQVALGSNVKFSVVIQNRGTTNDYYGLSIQHPDYGTKVSWSIPTANQTTRVLAPLEQEVITLTATIAQDVNTDWGSVWVKVKATHSEDETIFDERYFTAVFADAYAGNLATNDDFEQALPGEAASFLMSLQNRGTRTSDTFSIEVEKTSVSELFDNIEISPSLIVLASEARASIWVNVTVPSIDDKIIETGTYELSVKATSEGETTQDLDDIVVDTFTIKVKVMPVYKVQFIIPQGSASADPGTKLTNIKLNITNKGNEPATINVKLQTTNPTGYSNWVSISPSTVSGLKPNSATDIIATIDVKSSAIAGKITFTFNASVSGKSAYTLTGFDVDVNEEFLPDLTVPTGTTLKEAEPTELVTFSVKLKNKGNTLDGFDIELSSSKSQWADFGFVTGGVNTLETSVDDLAIDGDKTIWVEIDIPESAAAEEVTFTIKAISKGDTDKTDQQPLRVKVEPRRDLELVSSEETKEITPDVDERTTEVLYEVQVRNKGEDADTFKLEVLKSGMTRPAAVSQEVWDNIEFSQYPEWVTLSKKVTTQIPKGQSETITVSVKIPDSSYRVFDFNTTIWAYSEGDVAADNKYSEPLKLITKVKQAYGADIRGNDLFPTFLNKTDPTKMEVYFDIQVKNTGTGNDNFQLEIDESLPEDFQFLYFGGKEIYEVGKGKLVSLRIKVEMPADTLTGRYSFKARWISEGETTGFRTSEDYVTAWKEFTIDVQQTYGVEVTAESEEKKSRVGDDIVFDLTLANLGNEDDTFRIEVREEDTDNWATLSNSKLSLDAKGRTSDEKGFTLTIRVPDDNQDALAGFYYFNISVMRDSTSKTEREKATDWILLRIEIEESFEHTLETDKDTEEAEPGDRITFRFKLHNRANTEDTFEVDVKGNKDNWVDIPNQYRAITLLPDEEIYVFFNVTIPDLDEVREPRDVEADSYEFTVEVSSKGDRDKAPEELDFTVDVEQVFKAEVADVSKGAEAASPERWEVNDDEDLEIKVTLENLGNKDDTFEIKKPSNPAGWEITVSKAHVAIPMGDEEEITVTIRFQPTDGFYSGYKDLRFEVIPDDGSSAGKQERIYFTIHVTALVPDLTLAAKDIRLPSNPVDGEIYEVEVTVFNEGSALAEDVEVTLYDGNKAIRTDPDNIGAGDNTTFVFEWEATAGDHKLEVRINEGDAIIETSTSNNEAKAKKLSVSRFNFSSILGSIWFIGALALVALLAIIAAVLLSMNKNREVKELEEIISKLKAEGGPGGPRKVIKEAAGAPMAPSGAAAGLPSAPGKLAPVSDKKPASKENVKVQCPKCMTQQVVSIDKRPAEVPCKECGVTLVIPEKK